MGKHAKKPVNERQHPGSGPPNLIANELNGPYSDCFRKNSFIQYLMLTSDLHPGPVLQEPPEQTFNGAIIKTLD